MLIALACLAIGATGGWFLRRILDPIEQKLRTSELRLEEMRITLASYKTQVTEHFKGTAERVNRLTEDYRNLHQHLADGALDLCDVSEAGQQHPLLTSLSDSRYREAHPNFGNSVTPPLDYAPKNSPTKAGAVGDDYELERLLDD